MNEEFIVKAQVLQEQSRESEEHLQLIKQQVSELEQFRKTLIDFDSTESKEILSSLGKGVYAKASVTGKDLFVGVGADIYVKKTSVETIKVIEEQLKMLNEARMELLARVESYGLAFKELLSEIQMAKGK